MIHDRHNQTLEDFLRLENRTSENISQASSAHSPFFYALLGSFLTIFFLIALALLLVYLYARKQVNAFNFVLPRLGRFMESASNNFSEVRRFLSSRLISNESEPHPSAPLPEIRMYPELKEFRQFISRHSSPTRPAIETQFKSNP